MRACFLGLLAMLFVDLAPLRAEADITGVHHTMIVRLAPQQRILEVTDNLQVKGSGEAIFHLAPNLIITSIKKNGQTVAHNRHGKALHIKLGSESQHAITLNYRGLLASLPARREGLSGMPLMASEKGSYLSSSSAWHPYVVGIAASYHLTLIVPETQKAIVPGRLIKERSIDGFYNAVFESEIPTVGIVLIAGPFIVNERRHKKLVLRTYFSPDLASLSNDYLASTASYIDHFEESIGDYPFSSFNIVSGPLPVGLGFPGMTFMGERVLKLPFIRFTSLGHEVLHNWWGNGIKIDYKSGNWAEGLTTYMADYAFSEKRGSDNAKRMRTKWLRDYAALPPPRDQAVRSFINRHHDASQIIGYNKVAFIFHMLSRKVGEGNFKLGIKRFWELHKFQTASWEDIQKTIEQISGQDLRTFFEQWIDRSGAPKLIISNVFLEEKKVSFTLSQPGLPYSLNVPIKLITKNGEKIFEASISGKALQIDLHLSEVPLSISIDPGFDIFRRLDTTEISPILRDTTLSANTVVVFIGSHKAMQKTAKQLAARMMDRPPRYVKTSQIHRHNGPMLIIGTALKVAQFLHQNDLPATPKALQGRGTARVWASRRQSTDGIFLPLLVVEANTSKALQDLLRPLPHYGRRGYLVFNAATVINAGVWPVGGNPLSVTFNFNRED
jgi:aminopeptidase N